MGLFGHAGRCWLALGKLAIMGGVIPRCTKATMGEWVVLHEYCDRREKELIEHVWVVGISEYMVYIYIKEMVVFDGNATEESIVNFVKEC